MGLGLLCFSALGIGAFLHFTSEPLSAATTGLPDANSIEVLVPLDNIEPGTTLEPTLFRKDYRAASTIAPEMIRDFDEVRGLYSKGLLVVNQPVHRDYLTTLQPVNKLTASIPVGYRAIAIDVDDTTSVEGWAQPGARVDVMWVSGITGKKTISVVAENAKILSTNRQAEASGNADPRDERVAQQQQDAGMPRTTTLLLSNRDSLKVRLAALNGQLALVLRGTEDLGSGSPVTPFNMEDIYQSGPKNMNPEISKNLTAVIVRDAKTGKSQQLLFENGNRINQ